MLKHLLTNTVTERAAFTKKSR